jgi:GntR family transcriptional regulator
VLTPPGFKGALPDAFEGTKGYAGGPRSRVVRKGIIRATFKVAADLELPKGTDVVEIERVQEEDGEPCAFTQTQLPPDSGRPLLEVDLEDVSLLDVMERQPGIRFERTLGSIDADIADPTVAHALGSLPGSPVLTIRSISFDQTGRPVARFAGFYRGDRSRLVHNAGRTSALATAVGSLIH